MIQRLTIGFIAIFIFSGIVLVVTASSPFDIEFPVVELNNCVDKTACKAYCDVPANKSVCIAFARAHGLISDVDVEHAERVPEIGPGGCVGEVACRAYCDDPAHGEECVLFAAEHGFMEQEEADRILAEINKTGPGGCRGHEECNAYCSQSGNGRECLEFGRSEGHISETQYQRTLQLLDKAEQGGPGGCKNDRECRVYCDSPDHLDECLTFAEKEGLVDTEEAKRLRRLGVATGPGGCKGEQCRAYCDDPAHGEECFEFAVQHNLMSPQEAEFARKFTQSGGGPGGCQGPRECDVFCSDPDHGAQCLEHAIQNGFISPEEAERARKFLSVADQGGPGGCRGRECRDYCDDQAHREECFGFARDNGLIRPEDEKQYEAGLKIQRVMETSGGPGGCRTDHECQQYCSESGRVEECVAFATSHGGISEEEAERMVREFTSGKFEDVGPGDDFRRFEEEALRRFDEFRQLETQFRGGFPGGSGGTGVLPGDFSGGPGGLPGGPHGFPGGPGGPDGFGFEGPGGCSSPQECIRYCTEHREECFDFSPQGVGGSPDALRREGDGFSGAGAPRFRQDTIRVVPRGGVSPGRAPLDGFPEGQGEFPFGEGRGISGGAPSVRIERNQSSGFDIMIRDGDGIERFVIKPNQGQIQGTAVYSGQVSGCTREFMAERVRVGPEGFPLSVTVVDCSSSEVTVQVVPAGFAPPQSSPSLEERDHEFVPDTFPSSQGGVSAGEQESLRDKLRQSIVFQCVTNVVGQDRARALREGSAFDVVSREAIARCLQGIEEARGGVFPSGERPPSDDVRQLEEFPTFDGVRPPENFTVPASGDFVSPDGFDQFNLDPARICAERGGTWDGTQCQIPEGRFPEAGDTGVRGFFANLINAVFDLLR